ncbi:MAG TPA: hypothetical protein VFG83_14820 [Kofleriaceae bacterium]|nr:hypothetical protein [Kofleriaceae bacterium]
MKSVAATFAAIALFAVLPRAARAEGAHDVTGWLSPSGIDFVEQTIPSMVPNPLPVPDLTKKVTSCPFGGEANDTYVTQSDTRAVLSILATEITSPAPGALRVDLRFSLHANGQFDIKGSCVPDAVCADRADIDEGRVIVDFTVGTDHGLPQVTVTNVKLEANKEDLSIDIDECGWTGDVADFAIDHAKDWFLGFILAKAGDIARDKIGPMLEDTVAGFSSFEGSLLVLDYKAQLESLDASADGLVIGAEADITSDTSPAACIEDDPGDPLPAAGDVPDLSAGTPADLGVAVNLGLLNDVFYHVWRAGLLCLTDDTLKFYGVDLPLDQLAGSMLPGFAPGTDFSLAIHMSSPPRVYGENGDTAVVTLVAKGLTVDLIGEEPGGHEGKIHLEADIEAHAAIGLDPGAGTITAKVRSVDITRLDIDDQVGATKIGFDVAGIRELLENTLLPSVLGKLGAIPLTGSIFHFGNFYLLLRDARTTESHLIAKADLFAAPADDSTVPETAITASPEGWVSPKNAHLLLSGSDAEIPAELLRYRVIVDNIAKDPSFVRDVVIGKAGVTATYMVVASAMDLAGNEDPTPISVEVKVDGIAPHATIIGDRVRKATGTRATFEWKLSDDITPAEEIVPTVRIYRVNDHTDGTDTTLVAEGELAPGTTAASFDIAAGDLYRVEVTARDGAGNESVASLLVTSDAEGGCAIAAAGTSTGTGTALVWMIGIALGLAMVRRRRA